MGKALVTIIVPVYNLGQYIGYCLDSIISQTYSELEIILVDDGSTDDSLEICQSLTLKDSRVRVIHQDNGGVSAARNTGLNNARGEYIAFIDGDDIVAPSYIEKLVEAVEGNVLSMCMHERVNNYEYSFHDDSPQFMIFPAEECAKRVISGNFPVSVCGGIFSRRGIGDLRFPVGIRNNEDKFFLYQYLLNNEQGEVAFTNQKMYGYYVREGSATKSTWNGSRDTIIIADLMHELTMERHPEWKDISVVNTLGARFSTIKAILMCGVKSVEASSEFQAIKTEILNTDLPSCASKVLKIELLFLRLGNPFYNALVKSYYHLMNEKLRFFRNEYIIKQRTITYRNKKRKGK